MKEAQIKTVVLGYMVRVKGIEGGQKVRTDNEVAEKLERCESILAGSQEDCCQIIETLNVREIRTINLNIFKD